MTNVKRLIGQHPGLGGVAKHMAYENNEANLSDLRRQLMAWLAFVDDSRSNWPMRRRVLNDAVVSTR